MARRCGRRPPVETPSGDVPHGAGEGELRVQPCGSVEVPAHCHVPPQRRLHAGARLVAQPLAYGLRTEATHPAPAVRRADAADVGGRAVLRHSAARASDHLCHVGVSALTTGGLSVVGELRE